MAIKYVSKNKDGMWKVSATKTGVAVKLYPTQKEAIIYAATMNDVDAIMVKRESGWVLDSTWNKKIKEEAAQKVEAKKKDGVDAATAKAHVVAELTKTSSQVVEEPTKKETKQSVKSETKKVKDSSKPKSKKFGALIAFGVIALVVTVIFIIAFTV